MRYHKLKYLIVLDDVWTHDTLDTLRIAFPNNKKHSRILLTTRKRFVAEYANVNRPPHDLLTKGDSLAQAQYQRLVGSSGTRSGVENAAAVLLDELVDRNLVMATSWKSNGRVKSCGTSLSWDDMSILGDLVFLEVLKLKDNAFRGDVWKPKSASFGCLRVLFIDRTNLVKWDASDKQYSSLIRLVLRNCNDLTGIPSCLAGATSFQNLEIYCCSKSVIASARELHMKTPKQGQVNKSSKSLKLTVYPPDM
ncbi:hypothetical protein Leryth_004524 [Lithospermum erythrorhizon]|nr:hypothetical protein Leryth_004524 [Lithospermum erythrorhizon]